MTEAHGCEQLVQGCYLEAEVAKIETRDILDSEQMLLVLLHPILDCRYCCIVMHCIGLPASIGPIDSVVANTSIYIFKYFTKYFSTVQYLNTI